MHVVNARSTDTLVKPTGTNYTNFTTGYFFLSFSIYLLARISTANGNITCCSFGACCGTRSLTRRRTYRTLLRQLYTYIYRGKFGTVYKCQEKATGLQLAAKFVPIPKRDDRRNVEREVELMNALQHTLIIQLYDALEYQKMMCVVLEL